MIEAGWILVALVTAFMAYRRVGQWIAAPKENARMSSLEEKFSAWPDPEEVLERLDEIDEKLKAVEAGGNTLPAVVNRANVLTKDMLDLKTVVAEMREQVVLLRSKASLSAIGQGRAG